MREEKRRRTRDDESSAAKKKRDDSPTPHYPTSSASASKSRCHMPVSERQQFALLKLMETKYSPTDRGARPVWEGQEREVCESEKSPPAFPPSATKGQSTAIPTAAVVGTSGRYNSPYQESGAQVERLTSSRSHSHYHHGHNHSSSSSSHHSGSRKSSFQQQNHRNNGSDSPLMRASKKGDLLTLKMMVKEGADVNEQDAIGRTALHESSQQNFFHVVSYLLKHNANPNVRALPRGGGTGTGDTPLHEAAREGHIRIIRALLRYGADPKICNTNGDRPTNLCSNEASQLVFKQADRPPESPFINSKPGIAASRNDKSNQNRDFPNTLTASSIPIKKSPPSASDGHLQGWSSFAEEQIVSGCIKRLSSPDLPNSSPSYSQAQQSHSSKSPHTHSHHHHHRHHSPSTGRRNTVSGPIPSIVALSGEPSKLATKKDPYAFDDEEAELTAQPNQEAVALASTNQPAPASSSPLQPHRLSTTFAFSGTAAAVSSLHINMAQTDSIHSGPSSSVSPSAISGIGGPPLKLRFAMEAGHYTVMDNQEASSELAASNAVAAATSVTATTPMQEEENLIIQIDESNRGTSLEANCKPESGEQNPLVFPEEIIDRDSDDGRSPKVPPLRIKLGNSTPPPSQSHQLSSTLTLELCHNDSNANVDSTGEPTMSGERKHDCNDDDSIAAIQSQPKPEFSNDTTEGGGQSGSEMSKIELDELGLVGTGDDEEKKSAEVALASSSHQAKRCTGGSGKVAKVTSLSETCSLKRHDAVELGEVKLKDMSEAKAEETSKTRTLRTLRSHTAAQREKREREKHSDVAPLKKRKYRSKAGSGAEGGGGEVDAGKSTDHEDAGTTNEASSLRSGSTNGDTTAVGAVEDEAQSPAGEATAAFFCGRVFDDPNKPSAAGWGENPYEKAAELNRGLSDLIGKLVELQPKEPVGYQDYLLVTRDYLFAGNVPQHNGRRQCPTELPQALVELFEEQEDERHAQALKHQSEREQLRLCAEQSILRAQTRATIALANQPRPLSFCSVMALKGFTYLPPFKDREHRDEESVRDRFKARTLIGWLQDIKDNFHLEKKKLLCRQLHEAESLMMVQKLDWEVKLKELHLYDFRANIFDQIPSQHVPLIGVPSDFPLFVHDPIQRPS